MSRLACLSVDLFQTTVLMVPPIAFQPSGFDDEDVSLLVCVALGRIVLPLSSINQLHRLLLLNKAFLPVTVSVTQSLVNIQRRANDMIDTVKGNASIEDNTVIKEPYWLDTNELKHGKGSTTFPPFIAEHGVYQSSSPPRHCNLSGHDTLGNHRPVDTHN